ncbi:hypothetical protein [Streptomyces sp. NPDC004546]|uniref:hypothetical protein n=1 Tax=unclassified Streptomyces TaxID=2593676 RepID=UPI0033A68980
MFKGVFWTPAGRWRRTTAAFLTLLGGLAALLLPATEAHAVSVSFTTGAARTDQNGNALQLHGLGIIKVGSTWYGFGEDKTGETSSDTSFQDIPCYTSTDLANWTYRGSPWPSRAAATWGRAASWSDPRSSTTPRPAPT